MPRYKHITDSELEEVCSNSYLEGKQKFQKRKENSPGNDELEERVK